MADDFDSKLSRLLLVDEEKAMWKSIGLYVSPERVTVPGYTVKGTYITKEGVIWHVPIEVALDMREKIIAWWNQKKEYVARPVDDLDGLESRTNT